MSVTALPPPVPRTPQVHVTADTSQPPPSAPSAYNKPIEWPGDSLLDLLDTVALDRLQNNKGSWACNGTQSTYQSQSGVLSSTQAQCHVLNTDTSDGRQSSLGPWKELSSDLAVEPRVQSLTAKLFNGVAEGKPYVTSRALHAVFTLNHDEPV